MPPGRPSTRARGCWDCGYPGGPALERLAGAGDPDAFEFPTASAVGGLDFSFAGIKTALLYRLRDLGEHEADRRRADLAASYQHAIVEALAIRVERGLRATGHRAWPSAAAWPPTVRCAIGSRAWPTRWSSPSPRCAPTTPR